VLAFGAKIFVFILAAPNKNVIFTNENRRTRNYIFKIQVDKNKK
jgi:hypothetical protein